jgi:hypothetical protein
MDGEFVVSLNMTQHAALPEVNKKFENADETTSTYM